MRLQIDWDFPLTDAIRRGTLYYERGLEVVDVSGWMYFKEIAGEPCIAVFGDPDVPVWRQRYTMVRMARIVEIDVEEVIPLDVPDSAPRQRAALQQSPAA